MKVNLRTFTKIGLLQLYALILDELRRRGVIRSTNNPVADYTEHLVTTRLGLSLLRGSSPGFDATDKKGLRYQIKSRRLTSANRVANLGAIRNLQENPFDQLIAVVYQSDFKIFFAVQISLKLVKKHSKFQKHTNSWLLTVKESHLKIPGVVNLTKKLTENKRGDIG